jgi:bifunctional non-homologous end joining protein LigD
LIDGEAVIARDDGLPNLHALRSKRRGHEAVLFAFDLIEHDGDDLRDLPLIERNRLRNLPSGVAWQKLAGRVVASTPRPFENGAKTRPSKRKP